MQMINLLRNRIKLVSRQDLQILLEAVACRRVKRLSSKRWKILRNVSYKHSFELINNCRISESMSSGIECPKVRSRFMTSKVRWMLSIWSQNSKTISGKTLPCVKISTLNSRLIKNLQMKNLKLLATEPESWRKKLNYFKRDKKTKRTMHWKDARLKPTTQIREKC